MSLVLASLFLIPLAFVPLASAEEDMEATTTSAMEEVEEEDTGDIGDVNEAGIPRSLRGENPAIKCNELKNPVARNKCTRAKFRRTLRGKSQAAKSARTTAARKVREEARDSLEQKKENREKRIELLQKKKEAQTQQIKKSREELRKRNANLQGRLFRRRNNATELHGEHQKPPSYNEKFERRRNQLRTIRGPQGSNFHLDSETDNRGTIEGRRINRSKGLLEIRQTFRRQ